MNQSAVRVIAERQRDHWITEGQFRRRSLRGLGVDLENYYRRMTVEEAEKYRAIEPKGLALRTGQPPGRNFP